MAGLDEPSLPWEFSSIWKGQIGIFHMQSLGTHCCSKRRVNAVLCAEAKPLKLNNGTFSHSTGKGSHKTTHIQGVE